jgi:amino acid transporter
MSGDTVVSTPEAVDADAAQLARFGYGQELRRVLNLFENFAVAFCYISPVVGIYSRFVLGVGTAGPRYLWLLPIVVLGQLFVALVFAELGSHYPIAGALFQWGKNLIGPNYGWWVGWIYGWALIMTVASVDTGFVIYAGPLLNNIFHTTINSADPNQILIFTVVLILIQLAFNIGGVNFLGRISQIGVYFEIIGTFGIAILLAITGFHHGFDYLFSSQGAETAATNPLGVDFGGNWWLGAAFVAVLAHVYIFYGFESAGDVAEEVVHASKRVPRAIISSLLTAGVTSFILVGALLLAIPAGAKGLSETVAGGVPFLISSNVSSQVIQDLALFVVCFAFFSCGLAIQAAAARLIYSYSRDHALPASKTLSRVSPRFRTPVNALIVAAVIPALFAGARTLHTIVEHHHRVHHDPGEGQCAVPAGLVRRLGHLPFVPPRRGGGTDCAAARLAGAGRIPAWQVGDSRDGRRVRVAGGDAGQHPHSVGDHQPERRTLQLRLDHVADRGHHSRDRRVIHADRASGTQDHEVRTDGNRSLGRARAHSAATIRRSRPR